jgi:hypothetical protein
VVALGDERVFSFDLRGRPYALTFEDATYRRALDGRLLEKRPASTRGPRLRRVLLPAEGEPIVASAHAQVAAVLRAVEGKQGNEVAAERLRGVLGLDIPGLRRDATRFASVYRRVGMLPPDQYLAVVVEVTEGCSWDACSFCDLYQDVPFHIKTRAELGAHTDAVKAFFGEALALRQSVFLGAANALCAAPERLAPLIEDVAGAFPGLPLAAFVDAASGWRHGVAPLRHYAGLGLRRVYVGLETGDGALLAWLNKPGTPDHAVSLVDDLHQAGVAVGVIVLLGAGGRRFATAHAEGTGAVLARMGLKHGDLLYFSELSLPASTYRIRARAEEVQPLSPEELTAQRDAILARSAFSTPGPRIARYDIHEFVY